MSAAAVRKTRPNFLLLMTDQQTHNAMSAAGNRELKTPAMDAIAAAGVRYGQAICPYPVCSPSRSSIFTGRMPHETGVEVNGVAIREGMATMGEIFREAGYRTVYGGKWHLPKSFEGMTGFERLIGGSGQGRDMDAPLERECARWLRARPREPFVMVASFMNPHDICEWIRQHPGAGAAGEVDRGEPDAMVYHRTAGYDLMSKALGIAARWGEAEFGRYRESYYRMVEAVDARVGGVMAALGESGCEKNTIVCFCSDHGEGMGAHGWVQKASFYEESVRVPLIWSGPGFGRGKVDGRMASLVDILPTMLDCAGIASGHQMTGRSLRGKARGFAVSELRYGDAARDGRMVRTAESKYVVFNGGARREQLFDLRRDAGELKNLASTEHQMIERHRRMLREWMRETGDRFEAIV